MTFVTEGLPDGEVGLRVAGRVILELRQRNGCRLIVVAHCRDRCVKCEQLSVRGVERQGRAERCFGCVDVHLS